MYTISFIVMTLKRPGSSGIFCSSCRRKEGLKYSVVSGLFGWWGFPWGPIYTVQAIGQNSAGGFQDTEFNADLLAAVGSELADRGDLPAAVGCLEASLRMSDQPEVRQFLWALQGANGSSAPRTAPPIAEPHAAETGTPPQTGGNHSMYAPGDLVSWARGTPLHPEPSSGTEVIRTLDLGEAIVTRSSGEWVQVRTLEGSTGWIDTMFLTRA
jgi:hypothetical protein